MPGSVANLLLTARVWHKRCECPDLIVFVCSLRQHWNATACVQRNHLRISAALHGANQQPGEYCRDMKVCAVSWGRVCCAWLWQHHLQCQDRLQQRVDLVIVVHPFFFVV